jgi:hypothetical protein
MQSRRLFECVIFFRQKMATDIQISGRLLVPPLGNEGHAKRAKRDGAFGAFQAAQAMLSKVDTSLSYLIVLGTGKLAVDLFGPIRQFQIVGDAMNVAEQLSGFHPLISAHTKEILMTENTRAQITSFTIMASNIRSLSSKIQVSTCAAG